MTCWPVLGMLHCCVVLLLLVLLLLLLLRHVTL